MRRAYIPASVDRAISASAESAYGAWLNPELARNFLFATPQGQIVRSEIDPRTGGKFVMTDRRESGDVEHVGEFLALEPPKRIDFRYGIPADSSDQSRVLVEIEPTEKGCIVRVTHFLSPDWADFEDQAKKAWTMMLERLDSAITA